MVPTLFGITLISFLVLHLAPGKPTDVLTDFNPKITPESRERLEKMYNLDKPIIIQYGLWLKKIVRLDFGESLSTDRRPVIDKIWDREQPLIERRLFVTFMLNAITAVVILMISIPLGINAACDKTYSLFDKLTTILVFVGFSTPTFWLACCS